MDSIVSTQGVFRNEAERQALLLAIPAAAVVIQTLAVAAAARYAYIDAMREAACEMDVSALGHAWQCDRRSRDLLNGAISLAQSGLPLPAVWRSSDNVNVTITALSDLLAIAGAVAVQVQAAYVHSWALKAQVAAAIDISTIEGVIW